MFLVVGKGVFDVEKLAKLLETYGVDDIFSEIEKIKKMGCLQYGKDRIMAFR